MERASIIKAFSEGVRITINNYGKLVFPTMVLTLFLVAYIAYDLVLETKYATDNIGIMIVSALMLLLASSTLTVWLFSLSLNLIRGNENVQFTLVKVGWIILFSFIYTLFMIIFNIMFTYLLVIMILNMALLSIYNLATALFFIFLLIVAIIVL